MLSKRYFGALVAILCVSGAMALGVGKKPIVKDVKSAPEIAGYKKWKIVNLHTFALSPEVAARCAYTPVDKSSHPDTKSKFIRVFVNEKGRAAMFQKNPRFPIGSVIVKEKLPDLFSKKPQLLTVMIKQRAGYDPKKVIGNI